MTHLRAVLLAAVSAICAQGHAETVEWLSFPVGLNYELAMTAAGAQPLRIPARFAANIPQTTDKVEVRLFDANGRQGRTAEIAKQFKVSWKPAGDGQTMALVFSVTPGADGLLPGAYAVAADIAPSFAVAYAKIQTVTFSLTVPTPAVSSSPIVLHQTRVWNEPGVGPSVGLGLTEDTGKATASRLRITASRDTAERDHDDTGVLVLPSTVAALGPKAAASVPVSTSGAFALGKTTGKLRIESPELAAPTVVPFEVHARRQSFWIGVIAVAGVLLGYIVRVVLVQRRELLDARIAASDVIAAIDEQLRASDDATTRTTLQDLRDALVAAGKKRDTKGLATLTKTTADGMAAARAALNDDLKKLVPEVDAIHVLVDRKWSTVPGAQAALDDVRATTGELDRLLARRNATGVKRLLAAGIRERLAAYVSARQTHMSEVAAYSQVVADRPPPLPSQTVDALKALAKELSAAYPPSPGDLQTITVDEAGVASAKMETELSRCQKVARNVAAQAAAFVGIAQHKLLVQPEDPLGVFAPVRDVTGKLLSADALAMNVADPQDATANYPATLLQLADQWKTVLIAAVPAARRTAIEADIRTKVEQGDWQAAVDATEKEVPRAGGNLGLVQNLVDAAKSFVLDGGGAKVLSLPATSGDTRGYDSTTVLTGSPAQRDFLFAQAKTAGFLQSAVLALVFVLGLYGLYEESWIGTLKEMLALFLVAFGVDLTYDGVAGELKKGRPAST